MRNIFLGFGLLGLAAAIVPQSAEAGMTPAVSLIAVRDSADSVIQNASFWARPFPSGYSDWRHCRKRRVMLDTPYGPRWKRVCI